MTRAIVRRAMLRFVRHAARALWAIIAYGDPRPVVLGLAGAFLVWGLVLLAPFDTFGAHANYYLPMAEFASEWVWGWAFIVCGVANIAMVLSGMPRHRWWITLPAMFCWFFLALTLARSGLNVPGPWLHGGFALMSLWVHVRFDLDRGRR